MSTPTPIDLFEQRTFRKLFLDELPFAVGEVADGRRPAEDLFEDFQPDGRLIVSGRDQHALAGVDLEAEHRRRIEVREEDQNVVLL